MARLRTEAKQDVILEAASKVFSNREYHQVLCDEIAEEAGVGKGTLYRYFPTKEDLYFATITDGFRKLKDALTPKLSGTASASAKLERLAREMLEFFWHRRDFYTLLYRNDRRFLDHESVLRETRQSIVDLIQKIIAEGIARGEFRSADTRIVAELFSGMIRAVNIFRHEDDSRDFLVRELMGVFLAGIALQSPR